jgi:hypothetical protein
MSPIPEPLVLGPLPAEREVPQPEMIELARAFQAGIARRGTVRDFVIRAVPREAMAIVTHPKIDRPPSLRAEALDQADA